MNDRPAPPPRRGPPAPPPRRPDAPAAAAVPAQPPSNPFMASPVAASPAEASPAPNPFMAAAPTANPFLGAAEADTGAASALSGSVPLGSSPLGAAPLGAVPDGATSSAADALPAAGQSAPRVLQAPYVAPLQAQPGVVAPSIKDPHAEFRRGGFVKPLAVFAGAAAVIGGLFFLMPEADKTETVQKVADPRDNAVIGASVSPEIIEAPKADLAFRNEEPKQQAEQDAEPAAPVRTANSSDFAKSFKAAAQ